MEAGVLYEKAQSWDKAAAVYIKIKNWSEITFDFFTLKRYLYVCMPCTFCIFIKNIHCYSNHWNDCYLVN